MASITDSTVTVKIPGANASTSKMAKKGWKCWAKVLSSMAQPANDGRAYEGEWLTAGSTAEVILGDVILHVDQSHESCVGLVLLNSRGDGFIKWVESTSADKWAAPLAKMARDLLEMSREERIRWGAQFVLGNPSKPLSDEVRHYWEVLAGVASGPEPVAEVQTAEPAQPDETDMAARLAAWAAARNAAESPTDAVDAVHARQCGLPVLAALHDLCTRLDNAAGPISAAELLAELRPIMSLAVGEGCVRAERRGLGRETVPGVPTIPAVEVL